MEECAFTALSGKQRMAVKRQIKYRTDEAYRQRIREKAEKSKKRDEYKQYQRDYNRSYYQKKKVEIKMRRLSKKNSSFEDSGQDLCYVDVVCDQQCADEQFKVEHNEEVVVEEEHDVEEEEEEVVEVMDEVVVEEKPVVEEEEVYYYEEEVPEEEEAIQEEPDQWHSYPRPVSPSRKGGRGKAKRLVERECQADLPPPDHSYRSPRPKSAHDVVHLVDVGTQVSENEFMLIEEVLEEIETERVSVGC